MPDQSITITLFIKQAPNYINLGVALQAYSDTPKNFNGQKITN